MAQITMRDGRAGLPSVHQRQDRARALNQVSAREREGSGGVVGSVVEEEDKRFRNASELNPFEPNSMTRQLVND